MPDLIIKPAATSGNRLILKDQAGGAVLTTADSGATIANATIINTTGAITTTGAIAGATLTTTGNITMGDDTSIGIGDSAERIEFDGAGDISVMGANFGVGTTTPGRAIEIYGADEASMGIRWTTAENHANARNWEIALNQADYGIFDIRRGTSTGATPSASVMAFDKDGNAGIGNVPTSESILTLHNQSAVTELRLNSTGTAQAQIKIQGGTTATSTWQIAGTNDPKFSISKWSGSAYTENLVIDSSGQVGIGVTPSAWSVGDALDIGSLGSAGFWGSGPNAMYWGDNWYYDGGYKYKTTLTANKLALDSGGFWYASAPSNGGSAGATATFTTRFQVAIAGDVTVSSGDLVFGTAGKGVVLGATSNVDANTLDDYEEGTWTPAFSGTISFSNGPFGKYTKIGDMVHCFVEMTISSWSGASNNYMSMPFASIYYWYSGITSWTVATNFTDTDKKLTGYESGTSLVLYKTGAGNSVNGTGINVNTTGRMSFTFSYKTT